MGHTEITDVSLCAVGVHRVRLLFKMHLTYKEERGKIGTPKNVSFIDDAFTNDARCIKQK